MVPVKAHNRWVVVCSYLLALLLAAFPLSPPNGWLRPEFVAVLVIYWLMVMPQQTSMMVIWVVGCLQDLMSGVALGQHAMALMVVAYVALLSYQRMLNATVWRQMFAVFVLLGLHQLVINWVHSLSGAAAPSLVFLLPAFVSALLWPVFYMMLERVRRYWHVT